MLVGTVKTLSGHIGASDGKEEDGTRFSTRQQGDRGDFKTGPRKGVTAGQRDESPAPESGGIERASLNEAHRGKVG